ncbi:MAG: hemB [Fusobacteriales bacterium]|jgi:porphobilinogen synthase|nr:hemB [Fusobacteriales bacterium]
MKRYRRLRKNQNIRNLVSNFKININNFIYPLFIEEGENIKEEIKSMPGQYRFSIDKLNDELDELYALGVKNLLLFGIPKHKNSCGSEAYNDNGIIQQAIKYIKKYNPNFLIISDVCMCEYTSHGHCGILENDDVNNDETLKKLGEIALSHAKAGADIIAPSDMMDGRIGYIREILDNNGYKDIPIMAYSVKYASNFYGPFRDAADSAPSFGDRKTYQMDYKRDSREAIDIALNDIKNGADIIMVKPAIAYLDIISKLREKIYTPIAAYCVSGEYSMIKAAAMNGWLNEKNIVIEKINSLQRAGVDIIISYHTKDIAKWIMDGEI